MLLDFVLERQNPYSVMVSMPVPLHNLLTKLALDREVTARLLKCYENGDSLYNSYRQERLVEKTKKMSATITNTKLPRFTDQPQKTAATILKEKKELSSKDMTEAQRSMDIAKERGMDLRQILGHDVLPMSPLFDGDLPAHANKSKLVDEIEPGLDLTQWNRNSSLVTHVVVDFMSKMRQMPLAQFPTFGAVISTIITSTSSICQGPEFVHLVLDSYVELSLKEGEHMRRTESTTGIDIIGMNRDTPIPQQLDKFWEYWGPLHRIHAQQSIVKCTTLETYLKQGKTNNKFVIYGPQCETMQIFGYLGGSPVGAFRYKKNMHILLPGYPLTYISVHVK